jgi:hypothetical protein
MITKTTVIRQSTSGSPLRRTKKLTANIVLLKSGSRGFRVPTRMGQDGCGY